MASKDVGIIAVVAALVVLMLGFGTWMPHHDAWPGVWGGWGLTMGLMMLIPALFFAWFVVWVARNAGAATSSAQEVLDQRLARGEITIGGAPRCVRGAHQP